jgi:hypothetical protein
MADDVGEPLRYVLAIAYQAGPDQRIQTGADGARDYFAPEELEKAAWGFMQGPREIGLYHEDGTEGHAEVVESYIYRGPDWEINGEIVHAGDWLLGLILDPAAWEMYQNDEITGLSPQGSAKRRSAQQ